ncbi:MAG: hypothetical protein SOV73_04850 [Candidatus Faecivivens sp.]|nr:hypothetical protein [Candidatus Faecivivens sp.]
MPEPESAAPNARQNAMPNTMPNTMPPELLSLLQNEDTLRMLRQTADGLGLGGQLEGALQGTLQGALQPPSSSAAPPPEEKPERDAGLNPEMLKMVSALMQAMRLSGKDSPETSFLKSLKPLLRPEKSAKIDQALQMIQLMGIMNALGKNGIPGLSAPTDP